MNNISKHISYNEAVHSLTAKANRIDNTPSDCIIKTMMITAEKVFEPARNHFGRIDVSNFYRCLKLNKLVGGSPTSQHVKGEAMDIKLPYNGKNRELFQWLRDNVIFDQLIYEFGTDENPDWVHISYTAIKKNRMQVLRASKVNGKTVYKSY